VIKITISYEILKSNTGTIYNNSMQLALVKWLV